MTEFFRRLVSPVMSIDPTHAPEGKRRVTGTIEFGHGKRIKVLREDILQEGLARRKNKQAA